MNINTNDLNFKGRYLLRGKAEQVNRAVVTISQVKGNQVEFLPITCGDNKIVVVGTNKDAKLLSSAKKQESLGTCIKRLCSDKKTFLPELFKLIFNTEKDAIIIQGDNLARFAIPTKNINYDDGTSTSKYKSAEHFVDGTIKKYTLKGRLCEIIHPDQTKEEIDLDGTKKITHPDGNIEIISRGSTKQERKHALDEQKAAQAQGAKSATVSFVPKEHTVTSAIATPTIKSDIVETQTISIPITPKTQTSHIAEPATANEDISASFAVVRDKKDRIIRKYFENGTVGNYHYKENSDELLFIYYSDGRFESETGIPNYHSNTICFSGKDGVKQILDCEGRLLSLLFPDGIRKNFDIYGNLVEKIYPSRKKELFTSEGRMFCIVQPNGEKEYLRRRPDGVFSK